MNTAEILSSLTPKAAGYRDLTPDDVNLIRWQDILQAMQGVDPGKTAFMLYTYAGDIQSRHSFFAGLFMEVMQDAAVQAWVRHRREKGGYYRAIETLCLITVMEWGSSGGYTQQIRARLMGVSRGTWCRKYRDTYDIIFSRPAQWEDEVMKLISDRLT